MNIIEATREALASGKWITRRSKFCGYKVKPTNTKDCFIIADMFNPEREIGKRWNPKASDILADDYELVD